MNYVIHNPFDDYKKQMEEMQEQARRRIEEINQNSIWKDGESPFENIQALKKDFDDLIPIFSKIADSSIEQVESIKIIADNAVKQAELAKEKAASAEKAVVSMNNISKSTQIIAKHSNSHSLLAIAISAFALLLEVVLNWTELCTFVQGLFNH